MQFEALAQRTGAENVLHSTKVQIGGLANKALPNSMYLKTSFDGVGADTPLISLASNANITVRID